jgi:transcriptional regulator with XRE-family HTH domain
MKEWRAVDLAKAAGLDSGMVSRIEAGSKMPTFPTICKLTTALGISLDDLARELGLSKSIARKKTIRDVDISAVRKHLARATAALDVIR